jgi:hypothetical protein
MRADSDAGTLSRGVRSLLRKRITHSLALPEQPFDAHLLKANALYRLSRKCFLGQGGKFVSALISSPRTLTSSSLLEQMIEYSPVERELVWAATDPNEIRSGKFERLLQIREFSTSLFHEQSHRILWRFLPPPSNSKAEVSRYLNLVESLVIALDMALGDQLGPDRAQVFYLSGVTYDPGTQVLENRMSRRDYRNYLHACLYATYMKLEFYAYEDIKKATLHLYPQNPELTLRAIERAVKLDDAFVEITNPAWKKKHIDAVIQKLYRKRKASLRLPEGALDNRLAYLWAEKWFERMGL